MGFFGSPCSLCFIQSAPKSRDSFRPQVGMQQYWACGLSTCVDKATQYNIAENSIQVHKWLQPLASDVTHHSDDTAARVAHPLTSDTSAFTASGLLPVRLPSCSIQSVSDFH